MKYIILIICFLVNYSLLAQQYSILKVNVKGCKCTDLKMDIPIIKIENAFMIMVESNASDIISISDIHRSMSEFKVDHIFNKDEIIIYRKENQSESDLMKDIFDSVRDLNKSRDLLIQDRILQLCK